VRPVPARGRDRSARVGGGCMTVRNGTAASAKPAPRRRAYTRDECIAAARAWHQATGAAPTKNQSLVSVRCGSCRPVEVLRG
jgi:hypothetical protein